MKRILIADDRVEGRELVRAILEKDGYEVYEAGDGLEAVDQARRIRPDLVILDLHMPGLDGFGTVALLRRDTTFASVPVLALTASAMMGDRERALTAGFTGYVTKPIRLAALRAEVTRLLQEAA
jgi:two-component system cell cycle response regulator DivK